MLLLPKDFNIMCPFLSLMTIYWPTKSRRWVTWKNFRDKNWFWTFTAKLKAFILILTFSVLFLYYLFTNKARKLQSRIPSRRISLSLFLSLSVRVSFLLFTVYLSLSLFFVDAALQLLLCGVMSCLILISNELS